MTEVELIEQNRQIFKLAKPLLDRDTRQLARQDVVCFLLGMLETVKDKTIREGLRVLVDLVWEAD